MTEVIDMSYGMRKNYDPLWKGPMQQTRSQTNFKFFIVFVAYVGFWYLVPHYVFFSGHDAHSAKTTFHPNNTNKATPINSPSHHVHKHYNEHDSWFGFVALVAISPLVSAIFVLTLQWFAKIMVYAMTAILCFILFVAALIIGLFLDELNWSYEYVIAMVACVIGITAIIVVFTVYRKNIGISCEVIRESSRAIWFFPSLFLYPMITFYLNILIIWHAFMVFVLWWASSNYGHGIQIHVCFFILIDIYGLIWIRDFIKAMAQMILAGSFATWYWTMNKEYIPRYTIIKSALTMFRYHLGTAAFGSMIMFIFSVIRFVLKFTSHTVEKFYMIVFNESHVDWYDTLFGDFGKLLNCVTPNAYVMTAVHGTDFLQSAKDAHEILRRNVSRILMVLEITTVIIVMGQIFAFFASETSSFVYYKGIPQEYKFLSIMLVTVTVLWGVDDYFTILKTSIDTIFFCILEDYERNDGSLEKPYYMSFKLKSLLIKDDFET